MTEWSLMLVRAGIPVAAAMAGGVVGAASRGDQEHRTVPLVYFAAGAFLCIAVVHLFPEAREQAGWGVALAALAAGWIVTALSARWAGTACPACASGRSEALHFQLGIPLLAVLALHSGLDGFALISEGAGRSFGDVLSLAVLIHKLPEGLAIAALSRAAGQSLARALGTTAAIECCTFVGLLLAWRFGATPGPALGAAVGAVAGSFLCVVLLTLRNIAGTQHRVINMLAATGGVGVILLARLFEG